jgi:hypothetical protein
MQESCVPVLHHYIKKENKGKDKVGYVLDLGEELCAI